MRLLRPHRLALATLLALAGALLLHLLHGGGERALAHPLGNFTINRYARIEVTADAVALRYIIDMAEIPAFQERQTIDADGDGALSAVERDAYARERASALAQRLELRIEGERAALDVAGTELSFPPGQGGLETLRLVVDYTAAVPGGRLRAATAATFHDGNFSGRAGWSEVVVRAGGGARVAVSDVPARDATNELRDYPEGGLSNPLSVNEAAFSFEPGIGVQRPGGVSTSGAPAERASDRFTSLIAREELSLPFIIGALAIAFAFGTLHALGPGHGKTVVAAYLVGERGTARHALLLGLTVTATHTSSVFALGLVTLYASQFVVPERLYPWLSLLSGLVVLVLGSLLLATRLPGLRHFARSIGKGDGHDHQHDHDHAPAHGAAPGPVSWRGLVALGVSGGLLPCPSALVVLLGAISLQRVGLGMLLVVAFSAGLASVLVAIGLFLVWAGRVLGRAQALLARRPPSWLTVTTRLVPALPAASALAVTAVGVVMTWRALSGPGVLGL